MYKSGSRYYRQAEAPPKEPEMRRSFAVKTMPNRLLSVSSSSTDRWNPGADIPSSRPGNSNADHSTSHHDSNDFNEFQVSESVSSRLRLPTGTTSTREFENNIHQDGSGEVRKKKSKGTPNHETVSRRTIQKKAAQKRQSASKSTQNTAELERIRSSKADVIIPRKPFVRVIKQILLQFGHNFVTHISSEAVKAIQLATEVYLTNMFEDLYILALHARRVTIMPRDFQTLMRLSSKSDKVMMELLMKRNFQQFSRHGQRTPTSYLRFPTEDPHILDNFTLGLGELTLTGIQQEYNLGINLRKQYGDFIGKYSPMEQRFIAGNDNRTVASALALLAGLFPPTKNETWNPGLNWQPIPVHTTELLDAVSFGVFDICKDIKETVLPSKGFKELLDSFEDARYVIGNLTGINITNAWEFDRVIDGIRTRVKLSNLLAPPEWAKDPELGEKTLYWLNQVHIYMIDLLEDRSGAWHFDLIVGKIEDYIRNFNKQKFAIFSGHDTNIMSISRYLKLKSPSTTLLQDYASFLSIELHELYKNEYYVEFWLHPNLNGSKHYVEIEDCPRPCTYSKFRTLKPRMSSIQWYFICHGLPQDVDNKCTLFAALAGVLVMIVVILIAITLSAIWWCCHYKGKYTELSLDENEESPLL